MKLTDEELFNEWLYIQNDYIPLGDGFYEDPGSHIVDADEIYEYYWPTVKEEFTREFLEENKHD